MHPQVQQVGRARVRSVDTCGRMAVVSDIVTLAMSHGMAWWTTHHAFKRSQVLDETRTKSLFSNSLGLSWSPLRRSELSMGPRRAGGKVEPRPLQRVQESHHLFDEREMVGEATGSDRSGETLVKRFKNNRTE